MDKSVNKSKGRFISLEGCEGCGKSTQAVLMKTQLEALGVTVIMTREPGGTPTGEMIRDMLQHHATGENITPAAEVLLFAASRAQHVTNVIRPALEQGHWVICDRFVDSSLAYQAGGRGIPLEQVLAVNEYALDGCWPDVTLWFDVTVETALERMADRGAHPDRFESEAGSFHQKVAQMYGVLHKCFKDRIVRLDASQSIEDIAAQVNACLRAKVGADL